MKAFHFLATDRNSQQHNKNLQKNSSVTTAECGKKCCPCAILNRTCTQMVNCHQEHGLKKIRKRKTIFLKYHLNVLDCFRLSYTPIWWQGEEQFSRINLLVPTIKEIPAHKRNAKIQESKEKGKISQMYNSNTIFMYFLILAVHSLFLDHSDQMDINQN